VTRRGAFACKYFWRRRRSASGLFTKSARMAETNTESAKAARSEKRSLRDKKLQLTKSKGKTDGNSTKHNDRYKIAIWDRR
jgi:hypothetical protein